MTRHRVLRRSGRVDIQPVPDERTGPFEVEVLATARLLGVAYSENADLRRQVEALQDALHTHELEERAKGVIMGRLDMDADQAWLLLHSGANGDLTGAHVAAAAVVAYRRTPAEIAALVLRDD